VQYATAAPAERRLVLLLASGGTTERDWLVRLCDKLGDEVVAVASAAEARRVAAERPIDAVLVDVRLPEALALLEELRGKDADRALAVIVDRPDVATVRRLIDLEVRAVLERPLGERQASRLTLVLQRLRLFTAD
jgi:DNA-binding NarL/FixJ family response regulator